MVFQTKWKLSAKTHQLSETERSWWKGPGYPCGEAWESGGLSCCLKEYLYRETDFISLTRWKVNSNSEKTIYIYFLKPGEAAFESTKQVSTGGLVRPHSEARAGERSRSLGDPSGPAAVLFPFQGEPGASAMWMCQPPRGPSPPGAPGLS